MNRTMILIVSIVFALLAGAVVIGLIPDESSVGQWLSVNDEVAGILAEQAQLKADLQRDAGDAPAVPAGPIDINQATAEELDALPGIGPAKAQAIVAYRTSNGPFKTPEQLLEVKGIGPKILEKMKEQIIIRETP